MSQTNSAVVSTALAVPLPTLVITRSRSSLNPNDDVWRWTDGPMNHYIDFTRYKGGYERHVLSLKHALVPYLRNRSGDHVRNLEASFKFFTELTGPCPSGPFTTTDLSNFSAKLGKKRQYRMGTLNVLIQKWVALGLVGIQSECGSYLEEKRKPGNKKGEAVRTRNPVSGPLSEGEVKSLYTAVNAAYGRGDLPLWSLLLCRLLLACGGRISQYASLKLSDFDTKTSVLRLPQVKTQEAHTRVSFLNFDISPQTSQLLRDYNTGLLTNGYAEDSALFPEDIVMVQPGKAQLRAFGDLFFGHCAPATLSRRFCEEIGEIAPSTPRLDYAPLPVAPQRFRYTFGTRLVEEGASKVVVANRLGHVDLQNVDSYFSASPKVIENIDRAMGPMLIPLARAFQGQLVENEACSTQRGAPGSRIIDFRVSDETLGGCNQCGKNCAFNKPVACYTCFRFEPFLDAPHEEVRTFLLDERKEYENDERMAAINDEAILAVEEVMALCAEVRRQRAVANEESA
jgi:integrase